MKYNNNATHTEEMEGTEETVTSDASDILAAHLSQLFAEHALWVELENVMNRVACPESYDFAEDESGFRDTVLCLDRENASLVDADEGEGEVIIPMTALTVMDDEEKYGEIAFNGTIKVLEKSSAWTVDAIRVYHDLAAYGSELPEVLQDIRMTIMQYGESNAVNAWLDRENLRVYFGDSYSLSLEYHLLPELDDSLLPTRDELREALNREGIWYEV